MESLTNLTDSFQKVNVKLRLVKVNDHKYNGKGGEDIVWNNIR